mmetsp:Transcript_13189/g.27187  ORF Transcript_13189/g.27187 Transcript_13189/m.27187 type:complete len:182 (-) Transcript_13189:93-638(-)
MLRRSAVASALTVSTRGVPAAARKPSAQQLSAAFSQSARCFVAQKKRTAALLPFYEQARLFSTPGMVDVDGDRAPINITERCSKRIHKVVEGNGGFLRLRVDGGGCSGFQYKFVVDNTSEEDDVVIERDGAKVVVDESSLEFVRGSTLDFVEEMISSSFQVLNNPQSESSCGCGTSFAPKA